MTLRLTNTIKRTKEPLAPENPDHVTMYVCGPTALPACRVCAQPHGCRRQDQRCCDGGRSADMAALGVLTPDLEPRVTEHIKFSDRPQKRIGSDAIWNKSEAALKEAVEAAGLACTTNPSEGKQHLAETAAGRP